MLLKLNQIYKPSQIDDLLSNDYKFIKNNKKLEYLNIPISFDIETSSFYNELGEKQAIMYAFTLNINGSGIIGRTWDEFILMLNRIRNYYSLDSNKRIIIWVHNLAFEFSFMQYLFKWDYDNVFSLDKHKPVYALTDGVEFRCSYILSGYSLDMLGKNLTKYKVNKLVGDLDYNKVRHSKTPLTDNEYQYILHDGMVVVAYIQELLDQYGDFHKIPLTMTGFVRKYVRNECLYGGNKSHKASGTATSYTKYHNLMLALTIPSFDTYKQMKRVYTGGFTHCNALYSGIVIDDVTSFDFTSSYPSVMIAEKYPMSKPQKVDIHSNEEFYTYLKTHCCMFDVKFFNLKPKLYQDHPLSASKCFLCKNVVEDNGRVVTADEITTSINEIDFSILNDFYQWEYMKIYNFRIMLKGYLPKPFIKSILKLYELKTTLKGSNDIDDLQRYQNAKGNLNSAYGMCVTDILRDEIKFNGKEWVNLEPDIKEVFEKYNKSKSRFLFYPWGIWVTSYARRNLFLGIKATGKDYIYADTDSIKIRNGDKYLSWINNYNEWIRNKLKKAMEFHKLPFEMVEPLTIKGDKKLLGVWDFDGHYKKFKTLGAKRYMYLDDNNTYHLTCSGVVKRAIDYIVSTANLKNKSPFDLFDNSLNIPDEETGKHTHTYIEDEMNGFVIDYLGNKSSYHELSGCHLEAVEYTLSLSKNYLKYLEGIQQLK